MLISTLAIMSFVCVDIPVPYSTCRNGRSWPISAIKLDIDARPD